MTLEVPDNKLELIHRINLQESRWESEGNVDGVIGRGVSLLWLRVDLIQNLQEFVQVHRGFILHAEEAPLEIKQWPSSNLFHFNDLDFDFFAGTKHAASGESHRGVHYEVLVKDCS